MALKYCGLMLDKTPIEHWSKQKIIELVIRLVLRPDKQHVEKTQEFIDKYEKRA